MTSRITRRKFVAATGTTAAAVCAWKPLAALGQIQSWAKSSPLPGLPLNGAWRLARAGSDEWISATVPGCVHTDLLAAGKISDPFFRDNERSLQWIGETDWVYRRTFDVPTELLQHDQVRLRCDGLDTLAAIKLNGQEVGRTDNMFRVWE